MKSLSPSVAKILLLASLVIAIGSGMAGLRWADAVTQLSSQLRAARSADTQANDNARALGGLLHGRETARPLNAVVSDVVLYLQNQRLNDRISLGSLTTDGARGAGSTLAATPVAKTRLLSASISVKGTYADYEGLVAYLGGLRAMPVSLSRLKIDNNTFEFSVRVYGLGE